MAEKKRVGMLHTSMIFLNVEPVFKNLFQELMPDVEVVDFIDSDVLAAVNRDGCILPSSVNRMVHMAQAAESAGVDLIFSACSSLGPAIDHAREAVNTPIIKIDDAMAELAVQKGTEIGVLATVPTTLDPTVDLIEVKAAEAGKKVNIHRRLAEGAFQTLMSGDREKHDAMVLEGAMALAPQIDLLVLAQASMARLAPMLAEKTGREVLSSPRLAVERVKRMLEKREAALEGSKEGEAVPSGS